MTYGARVGAALAIVWVAAGSAHTPAQGDAIQTFLDSKALQGNYNAVVVDYLLNEGQRALTSTQRKQALDQLVSGLKAKAEATQGAQLTAAVGNLAGVLLSVFGGDVVGEAGAEAQQAYATEWSSWVDAADKLLAAGYPEDAVPLYQFGVVNIPYEWLRARCVMGLARAKPDAAYSLLMDAVKKPDTNLQNMALRLLGYMAGTEGLAKERKDAIVTTLIEYSKGITHSLNYRAAIFGLDKARDPRAVEALSRFRKGLTVDELDRRAALRSLLLTYEDQSVVVDLTKKLKTGMMSTNKPADRFYAGVVLMEGGRAEGFDWATAELKPKKGGFFSSKENIDLRPSIVTEVVRIGGERAVKVLSDAIGSYKDDEWLKTWMAIGLLELGDTSHMARAKAALGRPGWDFTAVRIATALAKHEDFSGISALRVLTGKTAPETLPEQLLSIAGGGDPDAEKARLELLKSEAAQALGEINHPDGVPVLTKLLQDRNLDVRVSAAFGLSAMTIPEALPGLKLGLETDYGVVDETSRNPGMWAHTLRMTMLRFAGEAGAKEVLAAAERSPDTTVKFLAMLMTKPSS